MSPLPNLSGGALISECATYRYDLWRDWHTPMERELNLARCEARMGGVAEFVLWVMLNPSTAAGLDSTGNLINDPTLRRCIGFTQRMGFRRLHLVNLYALRSSKPDALRKHVEPVGPDCDKWLRHHAERASAIVVGWGGFDPQFLAPRVAQVRELLSGKRLLCLNVNSDGSPQHPLFVPAHRDLVPWPHVEGASIAT